MSGRNENICFRVTDQDVIGLRLHIENDQNKAYFSAPGGTDAAQPAAYIGACCDWHR